MLGLAGLAVAANHIRTFIIGLKERSPDAESLKHFATKTEVKDQVDSLDKRVTDVERTTMHEFRSIQRSLGRIEGELGTRD